MRRSACAAGAGLRRCHPARQPHQRANLHQVHAAQPQAARAAAEDSEGEAGLRPLPFHADQLRQPGAAQQQTPKQKRSVLSTCYIAVV